MVCINFNITLFGLRGMLQHLLIACTSQAAHQTPQTDFHQTCGSNASLCSVLRIYICTWLVWWGCYNICLLVIDWPKVEQHLWGMTYLLLPCLEDLWSHIKHKYMQGTGLIKWFWLCKNVSLTMNIHFYPDFRNHSARIRVHSEYRQTDMSEGGGFYLVWRWWGSGPCWDVGGQSRASGEGWRAERPERCWWTDWWKRGDGVKESLFWWRTVGSKVKNGELEWHEEADGWKNWGIKTGEAESERLCERTAYTVAPEYRKLCIMGHQYLMESVRQSLMSVKSHYSLNHSQLTVVDVYGNRSNKGLFASVSVHFTAHHIVHRNIM